MERVRCCFAPMEGITVWQFRGLHRRIFGGVDRYFSPFLSPNSHHVFSKRELGDVLPEHNEGVPLVPQILTKRAEDFLWCAGELRAMGYREVNLNCGCPSGTVAAKGKGAGMLADLRALDRFLEEVFSRAEVAVSVKTRLGLVEPEEFWAVLEIYNRYPISELIIHPRVQAELYRGEPHRAVFDRCVDTAGAPLCYNGDLTTAEGCRRFCRDHPTVDRIMMGRGLVANPALAREIRGGPPAGREELRAFHDGLYQSCCEAFHSEKNAMRPMKEVWSYLLGLFEVDDALVRALRRCTDPVDYRVAARRILGEGRLKSEESPTGEE